GWGMNTVKVQLQSPGPEGLDARRLQFGSTLRRAPGATVRPSSRCWSSVRLLNVGVMLAFRRAEVTPTGPQLLATASKAITAAEATAPRPGAAHPARRRTGAPARSRRRRSSHDAPRHATIQIRLTTSPITSGP